MRTRMPFGSAIPAAILALASLTAATVGAESPPKPHEPKPKPPAVAATPPATASAAPAHAAAPATSGSAAPAGSGAGKTSTSGLGAGRLEDRLEALRKRTADRKSTLDARRQAEQERTRLRWGSVVEQPAVSAELKTHAERTARLERIEELAEVEAKPSVYERAKRALTLENNRHEAQMKTLAGGTK